MSWSTKAALPVATNAAAGGFIGGKLVVAGGGTDVGSDFGAYVDSVYAWDPETDGWAARAPLPRAALGASSAVLDGKLYVMGGETDWDAWDRIVQRYDPVADTWDQPALLPVKTVDGSAAALGGYVYAVGGRGGGSFPDGNRYDPATDTWAPIAPMNMSYYHEPSGTTSTGRHALALVAIDGGLHAIGGRTTSDGTRFAEHERYDPQTDSWSFLEPLPMPTSHLSAVAYRGKIHVIGGETATTIIGSHLVYDPATNSWSELAQSHVARQAVAAADASGFNFVSGWDGTRVAAHVRWALAYVPPSVNARPGGPRVRFGPTEI